MINYEKKYKEALKWIKDVYPTLTGAAKEDAEYYFPELAESDDERIRQGLLFFIKKEREKKHLTWYGIPLDVYEAYLEKQKEQKPNIELIQRSWYMEGYHDGKFEMEPMWILETGEEGPRYKKNERYGQSLEKEQKPAEWSKKDEKIRKTLLGYCKEAFDNYPRVEWLNGITYGELCDWLKSLCSKPHWKPSEDQLRKLNQVITIDNELWGEETKEIMKSLYNDLKKL